MKVELTQYSLKVIREPKDPKVYTDSTLLHHIKKELIKQGHDVIKKRMGKDGHLYGDDSTQYIRSRTIKKGVPYLMIYDGDYALRFLYEDWNKKGEITLIVERGKGE